MSSFADELVAIVKPGLEEALVRSKLVKDVLKEVADDLSKFSGIPNFVQFQVEHGALRGELWYRMKAGGLDGYNLFRIGISRTGWPVRMDFFDGEEDFYKAGDRDEMLRIVLDHMDFYRFHCVIDVEKLNRSLRTDYEG